MKRSRPGVSRACRNVSPSWPSEPDGVDGAEPGAGAGRLPDDQEERRGEDQEEAGDQREGRRGRGAVGIGADARQEQDADQERAAVAERDADAGEPAARDRPGHVGQERVVVDERRLVGEVGDREREEPEPDVDQADGRACR